MKPLLLSVMLAAAASPLCAQPVAPVRNQQIPPIANTVSLSGPRFGFTFLSDGVVDTLQAEDITVANGISQFGWQFERQFYSKEGGPTVLNEWVLLVGRLDQGVLLPEPELARRPPHARWRRVRHRSEHHAGRCRPGDSRGCHLQGRRAQHSDELRRRAVEGRSCA